MYCTTLSWPASERRAHQRRALDAYLDALGVAVSVSEAKDEAEFVGVGTLQDALADVRLLTLVLGFYSRTVRRGGFWNKQGNTTRDQRSWLVRLSLAILDQDAVAIGARLGGADSERWTGLVRALQRGVTDELEELLLPEERGTREDM